jgi:hypothetical protein
MNKWLKWATNKELTIVHFGYGDDAITIIVEERNVLLQVSHTTGAICVATICRRVTNFHDRDQKGNAQISKQVVFQIEKSD